MFWLLQITLLGMPRLSHPKHKQHWPQLNYCGIMSYYIMDSFQKIITDQGRNFKSELIENLCQLTGVQKLRTSPYHPQTNGQCEHFNGTLLNMLGTLTPEQKKDWKSHVPALVHAYNCTRNEATWFSPYFLLFGREPRLPVDVEFGLQRGGQKGSPEESNYISQLRRRLKFEHRKARHMAQRQQAKHRELYDMKCRGATLDVGDLVLVKHTSWKGRHKIQDRWESGEYQVVGQPTLGVPVYTVKRIARGKTRVLHRNLLLPLQGRIRQKGETVEEGVTDSDDGEEEEGRAVMPKVARVPKGSPRVTTKPQDSPTPADPNTSSLTVPSPPESMSGDEDSNGEDDLEYNTDFLTSHTTASSSTSTDMLSVEASDSIPRSLTESRFSTIMPYLESDHASDTVFVYTETSLDPHVSQHISQSPTPTDSTVTSSPPESPEQSPAPRRSARST